jgi:hypothetical protein
MDDWLILRGTLISWSLEIVEKARKTNAEVTKIAWQFSWVILVRFRCRDWRARLWCICPAASYIST